MPIKKPTSIFDDFFHIFQKMLLSKWKTTADVAKTVRSKLKTYFTRDLYCNIMGVLKCQFGQLGIINALYLSSKRGKRRIKKQYKHKPVHLYNWNQPIRHINNYILTVIERKNELNAHPR